MCPRAGRVELTETGTGQLMPLTQNPGGRGRQTGVHPNVNTVESGTSFHVAFMCLWGFAKMSMNIFVIMKKKITLLSCKENLLG